MTNNEDFNTEVCWICKTTCASAFHALNVKMCGNGVYREGEGPAIKWETITIAVPRCKTCAQREDRAREYLKRNLERLLAKERKLKASIRYSIFETKGSWNEAEELAREIKDIHEFLILLEHREFSAIAELVKKHWEFGEKPSDREPIMGFGEEFDIHPPYRKSS